jgi:lantibiotic modifying enzyme
MNSIVQSKVMTETTEKTATVLKAANRIGQALCATAYWDEEHRFCNWMGRTDIEDPVLTPMALASCSLGASFYAGSSGVALFLGDLYSLCPDSVLKQTAEAAIRRSIHYCKHVAKPISPLSFFTGHLGVAYVIDRYRDNMKEEGQEIDPDFNEDFDWLMAQVFAAQAAPHVFDVMAGNSGAIPILLSLGEKSKNQNCLDMAYSLGEELNAAAMWSGELCAWDTKSTMGNLLTSPPMTGFSHGASGLALALLELYRVTGEDKFLNTARGAFAYEDSLYNQEFNNWADVRFPLQMTENGVVGTFQTAWCHGASGIGLARLRAKSIDIQRAEIHEKMARSALLTTIQAIEQKLALPRHDATLCHGITGLSEAVLIFAETLDDDSLRQLAMDTALELISRYDAASDWPSAAPEGGSSPALMTGNAGIGYHFLRLNASRPLASPLISNH